MINILNLKLTNVLISKYKNIIVKGCTLNWSKEVIVMINAENTGPWIYVREYLSGKESAETFFEKELQKTNQTVFRIEKVIKKNMIMSIRKIMIICLTTGYVKKHLYIN